MRQLRYNYASNLLTFEYPAEWNGGLISGVGLSVTDSDGVELLALDDATIYTATTLGSAASRYSSSITLAAGATALSAHNHILIAGTTGAERHRVKGYNSVSRVVELENLLENDHDIGDAVHGLWCTYTLDTSDTDVFLPGLVITCLWTPVGHGIAATELYQISKMSLDIGGLELRFSRLYPRAYSAIKTPSDRFEDFVQEAESQLSNELSGNGLDIQRIIDTDLVAPVLMAKIACLWTMDGDIDRQDERDWFERNYDRQLGFLTKNPIWSDHDQDLATDSDENSDHPLFFERGW